MASRSTTTRETLATPTSTQYTRRDSHGKFLETDERGRALAAERRTTAKRTVTSAGLQPAPPRRHPR